MTAPEDASLRIPLVAEFVTIDKVAAVQDAVRVHTFAEEREVVAEATIERGALRVERVAVERPVEVAPPPREEGRTTIISLVEERLVVERRLFVVEEIHVTREQAQTRIAVPVTLRTMRATIERTDPSHTDPSTGDNTDG